MSFVLSDFELMRSYNNKRFTPVNGFTIDEVLDDGYSDMDLQDMLRGMNKFVKIGLFEGRICLMDVLADKPIAILKKAGGLNLVINNPD